MLRLLILTMIAVSLTLPGGDIAEARSKRPYLFDLLKNPTYKRSWARMVRSPRAPAWVAGVAGPASPSRLVRIGNRTYRLADVCKAHDCGDNQFRVLFSRGGKQAWGALKVAGRKIRFYGRPDRAKRQVLVRAFRN